MGRTIGLVLGLLALPGVAGCYNTSGVVNGGLVCGAGDTCPDGFTCRKDGQQGHCWRSGSDGNSETCASPFGPFASCSPNQSIASSTCDPVCQAGCPCGERCVLEPTTFASFLCEAAAPDSSAFVPVQGTCNLPHAGDCWPGSVCIADEPCPNLCYKTCRKDVDCPSGSRCSAVAPFDSTGQPVPNVYLCTPPSEGCNPTGAASCTTARTGFGCVFMAGLTGIVNSDSTVCDCASSHAQKVGTGCTTLPDDCVPGAVCVDKVCRPICDRKVSGSACPSGGGCTPIYGSTQYGYCK